jgi:hypothetical protein
LHPEPEKSLKINAGQETSLETWGGYVNGSARDETQFTI